MLLAAFAVSGCESSPVAPTVIPAPSVPSVPTAIPNVWESRTELAAWVDNTQPGVTVVGADASAAIHVDVAAGAAVLRGPDFDPPLTMTAARVRYRWLDKGPHEVLLVTMYLRPSAFDFYTNPPKLFYVQGDLSQAPGNASGDWVDELFTAHGLSKPPYSVRFATLDVRVVQTYGGIGGHGVVEIDRISLIE